MKIKRLLAFLLIVLVLLAGCTNKKAEKDPTDDGVLRILMIGNSFCYYFTDELYGMLEKAGIQAEVCNVYYSGCLVKQHETWLKSGLPNYVYITTTKAGKETNEKWSLKKCLADKEWDVITLQQHFEPNVATDLERAKDETLTYTKTLYDYLKKNHPYADLYWQQTWAYQVGYTGPAGMNPNQFTDEKKVLTVEKQTLNYQNIREVALEVCKQNKVQRIPSGDAWQLARANSLIGDTLCNKNGQSSGDNYHDGDTGGGQFLNACVWFEVIAGRSCVDNAFKPNYNLSDAKIAELKKAAHQAVKDMKDK